MKIQSKIINIVDLSKNTSLNYFDEVIKNIQQYIINGLNTKSIDNGDDLIVSSPKMTLTITSTKNQKKQINDNVTTIDLGECETKLKNEYNISMNDSLYILKIDIPVDNIQNIEYEIFYNFSANNLTKLNLSVCKNIKIDILIPKDIPFNEIDKYNKSSGYYNDICYTVKNDNGIDEPLVDRKNDFIFNNLSICEEDCDFTGYNSNTKKVICSCFTKVNLQLNSKNRVDIHHLLSNFKDIRNIGNFKMLSCIKLFLKEYNKIFKNLANYLLIILLTLSIISIFSFSFYDYKKIKEIINNNEMEKTKKFINENVQTRDNDIYQIKNVNRSSFNSINTMLKKNEVKLKFKKKIKRKKKKQASNKRKENFNSIFQEGKENINKEQLTFKEKFEILNDFDLNELDYSNALKKDNRTFLQLYISLLKTNHLLLFSFFNLKDYNSYSIKILIFFFTFAVNLTVSAMFYSDATMHKIYVDRGEFDYTYQLPQMFYSFVISTIFENLLNHLGLYEQNIAEFKKVKINSEKEKKILTKIKIKVILFFIIDCILLFFFWIYLGCFCYVYKNTQLHLLLDVTSSFSFSFITPFLLILFPCFFRILSLKDKDKKKPLLFKFSNFLLNFYR